MQVLVIVFQVSNSDGYVRSEHWLRDRADKEASKIKGSVNPMLIGIDQEYYDAIEANFPGHITKVALTEDKSV